MAQIGDKKVGRIGYGTMNLSWRPTPVTDEQAFESLKTAFDLGGTFWNAGEFYGGLHNLQVLSRFFTQNPEYVDKVFLSVKGGMRPDISPAQSIDELRASAKNINNVLGVKKMDLFEPARFAPNLPREEVAGWLKTLKEEGLFDYVGLSEVSLETLKKVHAVVPVAAVELEASPASPEVFEDGTLKFCEENNIALIAYSPLSRGLFTEQLIHPSKLDPNDMRSHFERFSEANFEHNSAIVQKYKDLAKAKGISVPALVIAWLLAQSPNLIPIPGSSRKAGIEENFAGSSVKLSSEDVSALNDLAFTHRFKGSRYNEFMDQLSRV